MLFHWTSNKIFNGWAQTFLTAQVCLVQANDRNVIIEPSRNIFPKINFILVHISPKPPSHSFLSLYQSLHLNLVIALLFFFFSFGERGSSFAQWIGGSIIIIAAGLVRKGSLQGLIRETILCNFIEPFTGCWLSFVPLCTSWSCAF